jgi:16S rRNA processing protein RimM
MNLLAVAKILKPRGVKGEVWVDRYREGFPEFSAGSDLWLSPEPGKEPCRAEGFFEYAKGAVLKLEGVDTLEAAQLLNGCEVFLPEEMVPPDGPDEFEAGAIIGWPVVDGRRGPIGRVTGATEGAAYWSFLLEGPRGQEIEIPAVKGYGVVIDRERGEIRLDLPEGYPGVDDED